MKNRAGYALLALLLTIGGSGYAQNTIEDDIRELMAVNGSTQGAKAGIKSMISMMKANPSGSSLSPEFWDEAEKEFTGPALAELLAGYVPIYKKHFSSADIRQLIAFYKSPVGQKLVAETPGITQESMQMGSEWGRSVGEKIARKIAEQPKNK